VKIPERIASIGIKGLGGGKYDECLYGKIVKTKKGVIKIAFAC